METRRLAVKIGVTLSKEAYDQLTALTAEYIKANHSAIVEAALMNFSRLPSSERQQLISGVQASKRAYTRGRWRGAFWDAMFDEFWFAQRLRGGRRNDFTPLTFAGFQVWFLLNSISDPDPEDGQFFAVQVASNAMEPRLVDHQKRHEFTFSRSQSPFEAARTVADFIRDSVRDLGILEVVDIPNGMKALLDHAGGHWMTEPELDPASLPIVVNGRGGVYKLDYSYVIRKI